MLVGPLLRTSGRLSCAGSRGGASKDGRSKVVEQWKGSGPRPSVDPGAGSPGFRSRSPSSDQAELRLLRTDRFDGRIQTFAPSPDQAVRPQSGRQRAAGLDHLQDQAHLWLLFIQKDSSRQARASHSFLHFTGAHLHEAGQSPQRPPPGRPFPPPHLAASAPSLAALTGTSTHQ